MTASAAPTPAPVQELQSNENPPTRRQATLQRLRRHRVRTLGRARMRMRR